MSSAPALPEWKLQLLERRRKEEEEARRREREQQDRMAKMPAWKREIIERRRAKQGSSTSFSEPGGPGGMESGVAPPPAVLSPCQDGEPESSVLREKIGPVHQNPFIQLEKRRSKESDGDITSAKAKQIVDLYGQIPGVRTLRADNVIIIESVPGAVPTQLASDRHAGEAKSGSVESLNELLARRGGSVTEIRAGEVFIVKSALSRSVEDLNSADRAECRASLPEQQRGRVSKLLSRFSQEDSSSAVSLRPVRSLSTENLTESTYTARKPGRAPADPSPTRQHPDSTPSSTRQHPDSTPSPPRDLLGLTPPVAHIVASYRNQFKAKSSSGEAWPDSPPRRSPTGRTWGREAASPERGPRPESSDSEATFEMHPATPPALVAEDDIQGKALANLRLHSRNSFVVVPRRASASPPPEPKQEANPSPSVKPPAPTSCSSPRREQLVPDAGELPEAEAMRRVGSSSAKEDIRLGGLARASSPHPAVQRRSGNTITINPRKAPTTPVTAVENGIEGEVPTAVAPVKKRYPTAEEIQVIGGYLSLQRSCLAKNDPHRKKLKISFSENQLERTFEYPSEGSLLEKFGPPEESESLTYTNPHVDDDDEEEELLLLHRGLPGLLRTKPLIVDESCRR
ncbi:phostensin isoform X1 [Varanus komodoensis]|uniref:Protein phosphatase 1 regulatory subunit 18 n=1 Tax=Varanus komodoensis TaxID=61221 RepID=A0A8D2IV05_VARKO|nr:phostensin isoform X1 [Varanus komodoensis]XP_044278401.1 phostensin isoform X1 [Varanus komodoensis]XP_044278402.1 phostensin isoform X1 [Varanus komodoensis]XP_044278403.1 phostensin isoform X1 [Varanus komodoensis]XP_044278405.1 phostensin isoform X1 [Varanus komodoensis]XP_044278406.1 phostensin isoform X1 [Varanus komodoensis]XP_044278407.1 phostensin isoform X1 [Varanus komodoensis]